MAEPLHFQRDGAIIVLSMDRPPANATGLAMRCALQVAISALAKDESVRAVVLTGTGRFFCAGADIGELGTPDNQAPPVLRDLVDALESFPKPLVAALNGIAYGGGLELALGCSHRVAAPGARLALPEVKLGLIPGAGGTQRLPRLIGVRRALDMILGGEAMPAQAALAVGLVDALLEEPFLENAVGWCRALGPGPAPRRSRGPLQAGTAQHAALRCVEAALSEPFERGLRLERELITELVAGEESKALRKTFLTKGGER